MSTLQDLAAIERIHDKAQKREDKLMRKIRKRGHVRMSLYGLMAHETNSEILELTTPILDRAEVRLGPT